MNRKKSALRKKTAKRPATRRSKTATSRTIRPSARKKNKAQKKRQAWRRLTGKGLLLAGIIAMIAVSFAGYQGYEYVSDKIKEDVQYPRPYQQIVETYTREYDVPESVVYGVMRTESSFQEKAQSQAGACGLMQLMPDTFTWLQNKLGENLDDSQIFDPETNIQYGIYYLSILHNSFPEWETVYAAYNAGPSSVTAWLEKYDDDQDGVLPRIPYRETAGYVEKVGAAREQYQEIYHIP